MSFITSLSGSSILVLILTFSGIVFYYYSFFYLNSKYIFFAFSFLLLSCREKNFVINGSQICFNDNNYNNHNNDNNNKSNKVS